MFYNIKRMEGSTMKRFARIQSIEITNFKNIGHGLIDFSNYGKGNNYYEPNVTAVYGQNGSGKTAFVEALVIMQQLLMGKSLPKDIKNYIKADCDAASIVTSFFLKEDEVIYNIYYKFVIKEINGHTVVAEESIKSQDNTKGDFGSLIEIIGYTSSDNGKDFSITPKYLFDDLSNNIIDLHVAKSLSQRADPNSGEIESTSLIFSKYFISILEKTKTKSKLLVVVKKLINFALNSLMIIDDTKFGGISENVHAIPIYTKSNIKAKGKNGIAFGCVPIEIYSKTLVPELLLPIYQNFVKQINYVLPKIVPNITINMESEERVLGPDGNKMVSFEIATIRYGNKIALKYESAGIKKILCILSSLIATYNNWDMCFVVDELDSGLFEYLLGQIVNVFKDDAKGQLIFTSHNLHVAEILDNRSLVFTRANNKNCYVHLPNVKSNNNKRLLYLKTIELSDDNEDMLYNKTNKYEMSFAFANAYDTSQEGENNE